jgi:hypothetical protein
VETHGEHTLSRLQTEAAVLHAGIVFYVKAG